MAGTLIYGRSTLKKVYQQRSQPKSWYQETYSDTLPPEWFDREHAYRVTNQTFLVENPFERYLDFAQYDEDTVTITGQTTAIVTFNVMFDSRPVLSLIIDTTDDQSNVNVFATSLTNTGFVLNTSAPFTGSVTYRAIYSAAYPVYVRREIASSSAVYYAAAGYSNPQSSEFLATFDSLGVVPTTVFFGMVDVSGSGTANVAVVQTGSLSQTELPVSLSAHIMNEVHYLAVVPQ